MQIGLCVIRKCRKLISLQDDGFRHFLCESSVCWALVVQFQHLFDILSCIAEARYFVLTAQFPFLCQPVVE